MLTEEEHQEWKKDLIELYELRQMSIKITANEIFKLDKRDFENGAVVSDIYDTLKYYEQKNKKMRQSIEAALRISDLWTLAEVETMFEDEAKALSIMKTNFEEALKGT